MVAEPVGCREPVELGERRLGVAAEARATARFSSTTGDGVAASRASYHATIAGQSVASAVPARAWTARISACTRYGPIVRSDARPGARGPCDLVGVPAGSVLLIERHQLAGGVDARRRSCVLEQQQREHGPRLVGLGQQLHEEPGELIASSCRSSRSSRSPDAAR